MECREAPNTMPRLVVARLVFPALHCWRGLVGARLLRFSIVIGTLPKSMPGISGRGAFRIVGLYSCIRFTWPGRKVSVSRRLPVFLLLGIYCHNAPQLHVRHQRIPDVLSGWTLAIMSVIFVSWSFRHQITYITWDVLGRGWLYDCWGKEDERKLRSWQTIGFFWLEAPPTNRCGFQCNGTIIICAFCFQYSLNSSESANFYPFWKLDSLSPCLGFSKLSLICSFCTLIQRDLVSTDGLFACFSSQWDWTIPHP